jgi:hypothetical protein
MIDYKSKECTWRERVEINKLVFANETYGAWALTMQLLVVELKGVEINKDNFQNEFNKLTNSEIADIGNELIAKMNHINDKKK